MLNTEQVAQFHYVRQFFQPNDPLTVYEIGTHKTPPSHAFGPAVRSFYLLHFIEKGRGYIERNGTKKFLEAGEAFLILPDEVTLYCSDKDEPWEYSWIAFGGTFAQELVKQINAKLFMQYRKSGLIALKNAFLTKVADSFSCLHTLFEVLNSVKSTPKKAADNPIETAISYLENNYFREMDIATLSAQFGFSRAYFTSMFSKKTGESPYRYLTKIRIERAKEFLINDPYSVEEIAYLVGFSSLQRFSDAFKAQAGKSPMQYRKERKPNF
jgi:AraC-like DNA-binding protein